MAVNFQPMYILAAGGQRAIEQVDNTSNNIANVNTTGFKKILIKEMSQKLTDNKGDAGELFVYPRFEDSPVMLQQGSLKQTERSLDLAITGKGFFTIETQNGEMLTRNGHFRLDSKGYLVDFNGNYVLDENNKRIQLDPKKRIDIADNGTIYQEGKKLAKLGIKDTQAVRAVGDTYYTGNGRLIQADFKIHQGYLESSNVNPVKEMVELINAQRRFEIYGNLIKSLDGVEQRSHEIGKA